MNMNDYRRRVAQGIYVGKVYKNDVDQDAFFSLSRATASRLRHQYHTDYPEG